MEKWNGMPCSRNSELDEVEIKQGIFQDSLSPLVSVQALSFQKAERRLIIFYLWMI